MGICCGVMVGGELVLIVDVCVVYVSGMIIGLDDSKICGVVISDCDNGNFNGQNIVIQDGIVGIVVCFIGNYSFFLGEEVEVIVSGQELSEFNGLVQVNNVLLGNVVLQGNGILLSL